ncbi:MAG: pitrilysin family protein [Gemmatimonadota bacterium]
MRSAPVVGLVLLALAGPARAQDLPPVGREAVEALTFPPLDWSPPEPTVREVHGVGVLHLEDRTLPLVSVFARARGGFGHYAREWYAAGTALPSLVRNGGSRSMPPDSVDAFLESFAVQTSFGGSGGNVFATLNTLTEHLDTALAVWGDLLEHPRFDSSRVEVWRGNEMETVRRRKDDPQRLAFGEFNRLMYGDHPIGWEMEARDLTPDRLSPERLSWLHARVFCRDNLVLGVVGDVSWEEVRPRIESLLADWPACPEPLPEPPEPDIRTGGGVFLIPRDVSQSTIVMAHASDIHMSDDPDYFASRIGNAILGGAGFQSRLMERVRTESGYAYSAASLWTAPRENRGLVGVVTRTRSDRTVAATRLLLDVVDEMTEEPPRDAEVETVVSDIVNGFVFNFESPAQIVSRRMVYEGEDLPADWLERFVDGISAVTPRDVYRVFRREVRPGDMTILVVGDPDGFDQDLSTLGPVTVLDPDRPSTGGVSPAPPSAAPRSRR